MLRIPPVTNLALFFLLTAALAPAAPDPPPGRLLWSFETGG